MLTGQVSNIQRYSLNDGSGIRTVVFLKGCPLRCLWCANPETQSVKPELMLRREACIGCKACRTVCPYHADCGQGGDACVLCYRCLDACPAGAITVSGKEMTLDAVWSEVEKDDLFYRTSSGGLTVSGGEPLMQAEFTCALLDRAAACGISRAVETSGYAETGTAMAVLSRCDQILFDVKHTDPEIHRQYTGVSNEQILRVLRSASEKMADRIVLRVPVVPGVSGTDRNIRNTLELAKELSIREIHLLPYHEMGKVKYKKLSREYGFSGTAPDDAMMEQFASEIREAGLLCTIRG